MVQFIVVLLWAAFCWNPAPSIAQTVAIQARVEKGSWQDGSAVAVVRGQEVSLRVRSIPNADIRWFQIVPNIDIRYNNAVWPWLPNAYQWKGFDQIQYDRVHLEELDGEWQIELPIGRGRSADEEPSVASSGSFLTYIKRRLSGGDSRRSSFLRQSLGSFWYQAEIRQGDRTRATPGLETRDQRGISPDVFRVSVKDGGDLLGSLTSYFNVPAVFGSTPYQVKNYIGIDCADVLMAAYADWKGMPVSKDYNVAMLTSKFPTVAKAEIEDGRPDQTLHWKDDVRRGDFIAVRYPGGRQYQHIGALYEDQNANGVLDEEDLVLHAGPDPLHWSELRAGQFDGTVLILRPM